MAISDRAHAPAQSFPRDPESNPQHLRNGALTSLDAPSGPKGPQPAPAQKQDRQDCRTDDQRIPDLPRDMPEAFQVISEAVAHGVADGHGVRHEGRGPEQEEWCRGGDGRRDALDPRLKV